MQFWDYPNGDILVDGNGDPFDCATCPCPSPGSGSFSSGSDSNNADDVPCYPAGFCGPHLILPPYWRVNLSGIWQNGTAENCKPLDEECRNKIWTIKTGAQPPPGVLKPGGGCCSYGGCLIFDNPEGPVFKRSMHLWLCWFQADNIYPNLDDFSTFEQGVFAGLYLQSYVEQFGTGVVQLNMAVWTSAVFRKTVLVDGSNPFTCGYTPAEFDFSGGVLTFTIAPVYKCDQTIAPGFQPCFGCHVDPSRTVSAVAL